MSNNFNKLYEKITKVCEEKGYGFGYISDGWDLDDLDELISVLEQLSNVEYELKNAIRGSYAVRGGTLEDLSAEILALAEDLKYEAHKILENSDNEEDTYAGDEEYEQDNELMDD